ncbi:hypothetical protein AB0K16_52095 [Nonomuraea jabiensis]|uniref:hypothetical protein n=1 Tax=Nonomuraea jabiensis TaxID=882448 RepID=UPI003415923E
MRLTASWQTPPKAIVPLQAALAGGVVSVDTNADHLVTCHPVACHLVTCHLDNPSSCGRCSQFLLSLQERW